jgi:hypothetical protein
MKLNLNPHIPTAIFGAGVAGQATLEACNYNNINIDFFSDNNISKHGQVLNEVKILHIDSVAKKFTDINWLISVADIKDIIDELLGLGYRMENIHPIVDLLKDFNLKTVNFEQYNQDDTSSGFSEFAVNCSIKCQESFYNPNKVYIRSVDIVVTEKCSMRCVDCSNLMQFFEHPVNYSINQMREAIELLCKSIDGVHEFRVIGGEPLMNKEVYEVIKLLVDEPKVEKIAIYTNGTIVPKDEHFLLLKHPKIFFNITDYSDCGENAEDFMTQRLLKQKPRVNRLEELCNEHNINYRRHPPENWTDCGRILKYRDDIEANKQIFKDCCCKNLISVSEGELHRCPFSLQITRLGVSDFKEDYLELKALGSNSDSIQVKNKMKEFLYEKEYIKACGYCPGRSLSDPKIVPAIQTKEILKFPE